MSAKTPSYTALVKQIVRSASEPLTFAEIVRLVERLQPIKTRSPQNTIRSAISQCYFIASDGAGKYGWYPRLLKDSRVRAPLLARDIKQRRVMFGDEARELLWPSFFAGQELSDRKPIDLELPSGVHAKLPLEHFGQGNWGTTGSPALWRWLETSEAITGDALIIEATDPEKRRYRVSLDWLADRDVAAVKERRESIGGDGAPTVWRSGAWLDTCCSKAATGIRRRPIRSRLSIAGPTSRSSPRERLLKDHRPDRPERERSIN